MRYILNAIFPTMGVEVVPTGPYAESSCAQGELGGPAKVPWQDCSSSGHPLPDLSLLLGHPDDPHCVQPACASLLATKHAKPTAQNDEATCGTFARLPHSTQLHTIRAHGMLGVASCVSGVSLMLTSHYSAPPGLPVRPALDLRAECDTWRQTHSPGVR